MTRSTLWTAELFRLCFAAWVEGLRDGDPEIIAIPLLLKRLQLTGALVTIDAMGTQDRDR